jgi:hypothetical protein
MACRTLLMNPPESRSFTSRIEARQIYLVRGRASGGREAWYDVRVSKKRPLVFEKEVALRHVDLADYGEIILSGYGKDPPESAATVMREKWGYVG